MKNNQLEVKLRFPESYFKKIEYAVKIQILPRNLSLVDCKFPIFLSCFIIFSFTLAEVQYFLIIGYPAANVILRLKSIRIFKWMWNADKKTSYLQLCRWWKARFDNSYIPPTC